MTFEPRISQALQQFIDGRIPGFVLLSVVATREQVAVPQALIDDPPAFAAFLAMRPAFGRGV